MNGWSFGIGKIFGVEIRMNPFFLFLLIPSAAWASLEGGTSLRGLLLWLLLLFAVAVREVARALAAAYFHLSIGSILLLPTGGLLSYASDESESRSLEGHVQRGMALAGPLANAFFGLTLAGLILTISPSVDLFSAPWVSPHHLLRAMVWVNLLLAALNLLPAWPLDGGRLAHGVVLRGAAGRKDTSKLALAPEAEAGLLSGGARRKQPAGRGRLPSPLGALKGTGFAIALSLIVVGILAHNYWLLMGGLFVLLGAQVERQSLRLERQTNTTAVGEVMLTDYSILPASATLEDAMHEARHSLQDVFPVVRGGNMVGAVSWQGIVDALQSDGNGYVQGIMVRSFQTAAVKDSLMETLNRAVGGGAAALQLVPVVDGETIVGILTPQHLKRTLGLLPRAPSSSAPTAGDGRG